MTTKELINHLEVCGYTVSEDDDTVYAKKGEQTLSCAKNVRPDSDWAHVFYLLNEYTHTPLDERVEEPMYRVPLRGFNYANDQQYLTADGEDVKTARFFASAQNYSFKQEFTADELDIIANRNQFKGVGWLQDLIRHAEPVEDD